MSSRILMATVAALALAAPATAQEQVRPPETGEEAGQPPAPMAGEGQPAEQQAAEDAVPPADMEFLEVQEEAQFLAGDEVIGQTVVNIMDDEVGTIADLVMDQEQKLVGVVLSVGGVLGLGTTWVAVPVEQIDFTTADQPARLLAAVTEEQLKNAPAFTTRASVEAEQAAEQAQQQRMEQQHQIPPPATTVQ